MDLRYPLFYILFKDPWKHASIFQPIRGGDVEIILTECDNCAHCADTKGPRDSDP